jgi:hypothetical protein
VDSTTRFIVGLLLLLTVEIVLGGTAVFLVRRWKHIHPAWSWAKAQGAFFLLGLLVAGVGLLPGIGRSAAVIVSLVGLTRLSALDVLSNFILSFCMGVTVLVVGTVLSRQLRVDLLGLGQ